MRRQRLIALVLCLLGGLLSSAVAPAAAAPPIPEPGFLFPMGQKPCAPETPEEAVQYRLEGWAGPGYVRYPGTCRRMKFVYGPIHIRPGQNDVLIEPVTIQKPAYDGSIVRFKPDFVRADGSVPPIEQLHLHHAVWSSFSGAYGNYGSFAASGEEKTTFHLPRGYGFPIRGADSWGLLYMIHNQLQNPDEVFITYDVDYLAAADAVSPGVALRPAYPLWLDVLRDNGYPVFNVQRGFGSKGTCRWPRENCARFDPYGKVLPGQGKPSKVPGSDWAFPADGEPLGRLEAFHGGTLIGLFGHLHPGGLSVDVDLVRRGAARRVMTSRARYWDWKRPSRDGGPPVSWDVSMTANQFPRWGVRVRPGDVLRINATYESKLQSSYEAMGIAVGFIAPDVADARGRLQPGAAGLDPFAPGVRVDDSVSCASGGLLARPQRLCTGGDVTHGHLAEADNHGGASGEFMGTVGSQGLGVMVSGFTYVPGDLGTPQIPIPRVRKGNTLSFLNADAFADVYHTITSCAYPCMGPSGIAFPLADGRASTGRAIDFDSAQLGFGIQGLSPAKNAASWDLPIDDSFDAGAVYTYFCRVHPFMRGAFFVQ
jgi:hypothetical protein